MVLDKLKALIADQFGVDAEDISESTAFVNDLGADSIDLVELFMSIEEEFDVGEVSEEDAKSIDTVGAAVEFIKNALGD